MSPLLMLISCTVQTTDAALEAGSESVQLTRIAPNTYIHTSYLHTERWGPVACNGLHGDATLLAYTRELFTAPATGG